MPEPVVNLRELLAGKEHDHGGLGTILAHRLYACPADSPGARFIDLAVLPAGTSIGRHRHGADRETYVVLDGSGLMFRDGARFRVGPGDVVVNDPYGEHGLLNDSERELRLLVFEEERPAAPHGDSGEQGPSGAGASAAGSDAGGRGGEGREAEGRGGEGRGGEGPGGGDASAEGAGGRRGE
ncbi:cupin domain-containing protein [Streptomyces sp. NPDC015220]|uniref:cupin domain-containing protein n=1 Tax=Streptomyces sp. NPDC015220 TaxID=3364947 RepID=UPI003701CD55